MVTEARTAAMGAKTVKQAAEAENAMTGALGKLFAIAEAYAAAGAKIVFNDIPHHIIIYIEIAMGYVITHTFYSFPRNLWTCRQ